MAKFNTKRAVRRLVKHFGSQAAVARALNVTPVAVSNWKLGKTDISAAVAFRAEKASGGRFKAAELSAELD